MSYFITGPGGSGKTCLIKQLQRKITKQEKKYISLCPTNLSALLVDGMTIHIFAAKLKRQIVHKKIRFRLYIRG
jgi:hypothetical protein